MPQTEIVLKLRAKYRRRTPQKPATLHRMDEYINRINRYTEKLDPDTLSALKQVSAIKTYKKGDFLLRHGEVCRHSFWIEKGILRKFYLNDGKEITTELLFDNDIALSLESYTLQQPATEFIQALAETTVSQTNYKAFQTLKNQFPELAELDLLITEYYAVWLERRLFEFHTLDATQRYLLLLHHQQHIIQNVPLTCIASYLGISLETLSRIRARI